MENRKLKSLPELLTELETHRKAGQKIVFTNGCFDILHKGHVAYLQAARNLGDLLVLGLNSDDSVKKLKGPSRPLNNQEDRAFVLAGLESITYLVVFYEDTPHELLSQIRPDVLVKGGDYQVEEVVGREFAAETVLIDFVEGYSTTRIISKMQEKN
jgi:rfaE bifunctional protein nucleotidyltransferase chain/domain